METVSLTVLLLVANVLGTGMIVPQLVRLRKSRATAGVSGVWVGVGISMNAWWLGYGIQGNLWGLIPVSLVAGILYALTARELLAIEFRATIRPLIIGLITVGTAPLPFLILGGWDLAGVAIGLGYGLQFSPAAVSAVRAAWVDGISPITWVMAWVEAVIWLIYGLAVDDAALIIGGTGGAAMAAVILSQVGKARSTDKPAFYKPTLDQTAPDQTASTQEAAGTTMIQNG